MKLSVKPEPLVDVDGAVEGSVFPLPIVDRLMGVVVASVRFPGIDCSLIVAVVSLEIPITLVGGEVASVPISVIGVSVILDDMIFSGVDSIEVSVEGPNVSSSTVVEIVFSVDFDELP